MWELIFIIPIVAIVFGITSDIIKRISNNRFKAKQLQFMLLEKELDAGIPPGTYSGVKNYKSSRNWKQWQSTSSGTQDRQAPPQRPNRADLEKGIDDLLKRMENLDTVLNEKSARQNNNRQHHTDEEK